MVTLNNEILKYDFIIKRIININTQVEVCPQYINQICSNIKIIKGEPLRVRYKNGLSFQHEIVKDYNIDEGSILIKTTKKIWELEITN